MEFNMDRHSPTGIDMVQALRESSFVERLHAMPHHTPYPVGLHCYNMVMMLRVLWPGNQPPPEVLVWAILTHDFAERWVGDMPYPAKQISPDLGAKLLDLERFIEHKTLGSVTYVPPEYEPWLKALDLAELFCWCEDELAMGNRNVEFMRDSIIETMNKSETFPAEVVDYVNNFVWHRTNDLLYDKAHEDFYGD